MPEKTAVTCLGCGAEMNRHAEKVDHDPLGEDAPGWDGALGGVLFEFHSCAECHATEQRPVAPD